MSNLEEVLGYRLYVEPLLRLLRAERAVLGLETTMDGPSPRLTPDELRLIQKLLDALAEQLGRDDYGWSYEDECLRLQVREVIDRELNKE